MQRNTKALAGKNCKAYIRNGTAAPCRSSPHHPLAGMPVQSDWHVCESAVEAQALIALEHSYKKEIAHLGSDASFFSCSGCLSCSEASLGGLAAGAAALTFGTGLAPMRTLSSTFAPSCSIFAACKWSRRPSGSTSKWLSAWDLLLSSSALYEQLSADWMDCLQYD